MKSVVEECLLSVETTGDTFRAQFRFPPHLKVFEGHFPGAPLVPGVFLLEAARVAAERATGRAFRIARVKDAKFMQMVKPDDLVEIDGKIHENRLTATLSAGSRVELDLAPFDC